MRKPAAALATWILAGALAACGQQKPDESDSGARAAPAHSSHTSGDGPTAPSAAATPAPITDRPPVAFFQCHSCHAIEPGRNGIGPSLHGIFGQKAGTAPGFGFSKALRESEITWDRATMEQWLVSPTRMVPGTRMVNSVPDPVRRKEIIDYLETLQ